MKKLLIGSGKDKRVYRIIAAVFFALCVTIGFLSFWYYQRLQDTIKAESRGYMQEISRQMCTSVSKSIDDKYAVLETLASVFENQEVTSYSEMRRTINEQQKIWDYQKALLIDKNGIAYDASGNTVLLRSDTYLQEVLVERKPSLSTSQVIDGKDSIVFVIPVQSLSIDGTEMKALGVCYELSTFDQLLAMTAFEGQGYAHIVNSDGAVVIRSSSKNATQAGYNILNSLKPAEIMNGKTMDDIQQDIALGKSGHVEYKLGRVHEEMTYTAMSEQGWSLLSFVPVAVVNEKSNMMLNVTLLLCGFVTFAFAGLLVGLMLIAYRNKRRLEQIAYVDPITEGHTIERFYELAKERLEETPKLKYALVYSNIEKFKVLNEQAGRESCDMILRGIEKGIRENLSPAECVGRLFADNFCILVEYTSSATLVDRLERWTQNAANYTESHGQVWLPFLLEFGVYIIDNTSMPFPQMIDRAKLSLSEAAGEFRGKMRYAIYDEQVRRQLFRDKQLEDRMDEALEGREFQMYLQPKYNTQTERVGGAEALVRWASRTEGMIFPDEFIPLFEKNGFVIQLDFYMFEELCKTIRGWLDEGIQPVKISVNCSRLHLKNADFLRRYNTIADSYAVPRSLIEIELTESTVFGDVEHLCSIIKKIQAAGYGCSMDDFGSGYSSLNLIQDIPVDTLKLDRIFFRTSRDLQRSESVAGSIISMAKALDMETVAEGVEERTQVDMLKRLNCDYIQGYYFAKPMPVADFERLAFGKKTSDGKSKP